MKSQTKKCQNCNSEFLIEPEDFEFYEKMKVPAPTWCPECRMQRRMMFRNERTLYKRKCDLCKETIITQYPENTPFPVYCQTCWGSDKQDNTKYSQDYDLSRSFLEQIKALQQKVPRPHTTNTINARLINSTYTNCAGDLKNCYLIFGALDDWDCYYSHYIYNSRDCFDNFYCFKSEKSYGCFDIEHCYNLLFSHSCVQCRDSIFLFDCRNCSDCIACSGLRNKSYYIFNKPYTKEEYLKKKEEMGLGSYQNIVALKEKYYKEVYFQSPRKFYHGQMNNKFSGDYVSNSEKTYDSFYTKNARKCKFCFWCINGLDVYDYLAWGDLEFSYECVSCGDKSYNCKFSHTSWRAAKDLEYCNLCFSSSNLFGCVGLVNKQYCILNKQYTKAEYEEFVPKIIEHMNNMSYKDKKGRIYKYGEFFPPELSPFSYNETIAQEYFPLTKEKALAQGYAWYDRATPEHKPTIKAVDLPDNIKDVKDDILNEVIQCAHTSDRSLDLQSQCTTAFKIIPQELEFYRKMNLPLPRLCPNCRHYERIQQRNPLKLWKRQCQCAGAKSSNGVYANTAKHAHNDKPCPNEFQTTYAPERKEIVYCEKCYLAEVV